MKIVKTLICYGLRHVIGDVADKAVDAVVERFTDESDALPKAVVAANERAWQALHVALAGDSYWEKFKRFALGDATERAFGNRSRRSSATSLPQPRRSPNRCAPPVWTT